MVPWWGCVKGGWWSETSEGKKKWAGSWWWDGILGDFWRSWSATSSPFPPIPPNHNKATSLIEINKLILLQFAHTHTHNWNMNVWTLRDTHAYTQGKNWFIPAHTHTHATPSHECGRCIPAIYKTQTLSCNYCFWCVTIAIVWKSVKWNQLSRSFCLWRFFLCIHVKLDNWSDMSHCVVHFVCTLFYSSRKPNFSNIFSLKRWNKTLEKLQPVKS